MDINIWDVSMKSFHLLYIKRYFLNFSKINHVISEEGIIAIIMTSNYESQELIWIKKNL